MSTTKNLNLNLFETDSEIKADPVNANSNILDALKPLIDSNTSAINVLRPLIEANKAPTITVDNNARNNGTFRWCIAFPWGWAIQGGDFTLSSVTSEDQRSSYFIKPFKNTNYVVIPILRVLPDKDSFDAVPNDPCGYPKVYKKDRNFFRAIFQNYENSHYQRGDRPYNYIAIGQI